MGRRRHWFEPSPSKVTSIRTSLVKTVLALLLARSVNDPLLKIVLPIVNGQPLHTPSTCANLTSLAAASLFLGSFLLYLLSRTTLQSPEITLLPTVVGMAVGAQVSKVTKVCRQGELSHPYGLQHLLEELWFAVFFSLACVCIFVILIWIKRSHVLARWAETRVTGAVDEEHGTKHLSHRQLAFLLGTDAFISRIIDLFSNFLAVAAAVCSRYLQLATSHLPFQEPVPVFCA